MPEHQFKVKRKANEMVNITHKQFGDKNSDESKDAEYLKNKLSEIDSDGEILIISNLSLPGGEAVKDIDILVIGYLNDYIIYPSSHHSDSRIDTLKVSSFCFTIEHKRHDINGVEFNQYGTVSVRYGSSMHDVVTQSRKQRDSLRNVIKRETGIEPYVINLIWLKNINETDVPYSKTGWNVLFGSFDADTLFETAARSNKLSVDWYSPNIARLFSFKQPYFKKELSAIFDLFQKSTRVNDNLAREKFEYITNRNESVSVDRSGKLNIIKGRAGTGKTIQLIKFAYQEVVENHRRCVLLTYNHALVSDIKRVATYCDFPDGVEEAFCVQTIHSFFIQILEYNGIQVEFPDGQFENLYKSKLDDLYNKEEINVPVCWDYVLIDEAQDCTAEEIKLWGRLYNEEQIVIADGIDQFVRNIQSAPWTAIFNNNLIFTNQLDVSKRQKSNIVSFVNAFACKTGLSWSVNENPDLPGGQVIITNRFNKELYDELKDRLIESGNIMYDMLMLVDSTMGSAANLPRIINGLQRIGINIFNGAQQGNKNKYPINPDESRLYNYNSCRGIEGWTVVCLYLDELIKEKMRFAAYMPKQNFESEIAYQERKNREIYKWILLPFTRAIDTLVIVLHDVDSPIGKILKDLQSERKDYVTWNIL